jgi:hypothetical protein
MLQALLSSRQRVLSCADFPKCPADSYTLPGFPEHKAGLQERLAGLHVRHMSHLAMPISSRLNENQSD